MEKIEAVGVRYIVNDIDKAINFYTDLLGFEVTAHSGNGSAALSKGNLMLYLNKSSTDAPEAEISDVEPAEQGSRSRIRIPVDNLGLFQAELKRKDIKPGREIINNHDGKQMILTDPSGNLLEIFEPQIKKPVSAVPEGYHTITPFLLVNGAENFIKFIKEAFNGVATYMMKSDDGNVMHATMRIGNSLVMIADSSDSFLPLPGMLYVYVENVDEVYEKALKAGGVSLREPTDEFYGDRSAGVKDEWNNQWWLATHIEDVSDIEMKKREEAFRKKAGRESEG